MVRGRVSPARSPGVLAASGVAGLAGALATLAASWTPVIAVGHDHVTGIDRHGPALLLLGAAALVLVGASLYGVAATAAALTTVGIAVLGIALAFDLPHVHDSGSLGDVTQFTRAAPGAGYYLETAGGVLLLLSGATLLLLGSPRATTTTRTGGRRPTTTE